MLALPVSVSAAYCRFASLCFFNVYLQQNVTLRQQTFFTLDSIKIRHPLLPHLQNSSLFANP